LRIVAIANQKGGCGKTTTSIHLAACLSHLQHKTLLVDFDPQGHSTCGLGIRAEELPHTLFDLLHPAAISGSLALSEVAVYARPHLYVMPSYVVLGDLEDLYQDFEGLQEAFLRVLDLEALEREGFETVLIDCPPNLGKLTRTALWAAGEVIVPIEPSFFSLHGLAKISETLEKINLHREQPLKIHALMTLVDTRNAFSGEVHANVRKHFGTRLFQTLIREDGLFKEAAGAGQTIVDYAPQSQAFEDYRDLALEFLERGIDESLMAAAGPEGSRRFGPRRVVGGMLFQIAYAQAQSVEIAGDFNRWIPEKLRKREGGLWQLVLSVASGRHRYKFIVDGEWRRDPYQPLQLRNGFGGYDSYLELEHSR